MPTGYTCEIEKGQTFRDFALGCARAFGALMSMRDDPLHKPIPDEFQPSTHNKERADEARAQLDELKTCTPEHADEMAAKQFADECDDVKRRFGKNAALRAKYNAMLAQVQAYQPPTPKHEEFKAFMIEQIQSSIKFDCSDSYITAPRRMTGREWLQEQTDSAVKDIAYHEKEYAAEVNRCAERTAWVMALKESLKP